MEPGHAVVVELAAKARPPAKMALPLPSSRLPDFRRTSLAAAEGGLEGGRSAGGALLGATQVARGVATQGLLRLPTFRCSARLGIYTRSIIISKKFAILLILLLDSKK